MGNDELQELQRLVDALAGSAESSSFDALLDKLREMAGANYHSYLRALLRNNPNLVIPQSDLSALQAQQDLNSLFQIKQQAIKREGRRVAVFCMPKSGSSFTQSAIQSATGSPFVLLTSHGSGKTIQDMNGREQELCEFAILSAMLGSRGSFVAQHHTKCTPYLCHQLETYGLLPLVTVRNVFDSLISYDEMMCSWRQKSGSWRLDGPVTLPENYHRLEMEQRLSLLLPYGIWLIAFYVSWKRCEELGLVKPLWVSYENDLLNKDVYVEKLSNYLEFSDTERRRLESYVANPDSQSSRLNKGVAGRGRSVPDDLKAFLISYAENFQSELEREDWQQLFGD